MRAFFFRNRSYTPVPFLIAMIFLAKPTVFSLVGGFLLAVPGELLRLWAVSHAGGRTRRTDHADADYLVTHGPFAIMRNPLYVGNFFLHTGVLVMAWAVMPWMLLIYWVFFFVQYALIISLEEETLQQKFGPEYYAYSTAVPRFIPRRTVYAIDNDRGRPLKEVIRTERQTLLSFSLVTLLIVLRWLI